MPRPVKYTEDFKAQVAIDVLKGEITNSSIAKKYDIHQSYLSKWKKDFVDDLSVDFANGDYKKNRGLKALTEELFIILADTTLINAISLSDREKQVLQMLWKDQMNFTAIAGVMRLRKEKIRQIHKEAMIKLKYGLYVVIEQNKKFEELNTSIKTLEQENFELKKRVKKLSLGRDISDVPDKIMNVNILAMKLSTRLRNGLVAASIRTIGDLQNWDKETMVAHIPRFGEICLSELESRLKEYDLKWWK
jgi:transposase-like protein